MTRDWDAEYQAKYRQRLADMAQADYEKYVAMEQRRTLPTDLDRLDRTEEVARANQALVDEERRKRYLWQGVAILSAACFVLLAGAVAVFGDRRIVDFVVGLFSR